jgi:hypothetical protein
MSYLDRWIEGLLQHQSLNLKDPIRIDGVRDVHLGPRMEFAKFTAIVEPARAFEVSFQLPQSQLTSERQAFLDQAILGLLDVLMTGTVYPLRNIRVRVIETEFDPINSSASAFRQAGRDAGRKLLDSLKDPRRS